MSAGRTHAVRGNGAGVGTTRSVTEVQKVALLAKSQVSHEFYMRMARTEIVFEPY